MWYFYSMDTQQNKETLGTIIVYLPLVASVAVLINVFDIHESVFVYLTVLSTSVLIFLEARKIGLGAEGKKETGPVAWLLFGLLLWVIAHPAYLYKRQSGGLRNLCLHGIITDLCFLASLSITAAVRTI